MPLSETISISYYTNLLNIQYRILKLSETLPYILVVVKRKSLPIQDESERSSYF
jgi:hypothetical protein